MYIAPVFTGARVRVVRGVRRRPLAGAPRLDAGGRPRGRCCSGSALRARRPRRPASIGRGACSRPTTSACMYSRAALMEATMIAVLVVAGWYASSRARRRAARGASSPRPVALLAYFTKASAVFFVAALARARRAGRSVALARGVAARRGRAVASRGAVPLRARSASADARGARLAGRASGARGFVLPNWQRLPLLQLADVGDAQAELHGQGVRRSRHRGSRSSTTSSRGCGSRSSSAPRRRWGWLARCAARARRRAPAAGVDRRRRRWNCSLHDVGQRAASGLPHPRARSASPRWPLAATGGCCRHRSATCRGAGGCWRASARALPSPTSWRARWSRLAFLYEIGPVGALSARSRCCPRRGAGLRSVAAPAAAAGGGARWASAQPGARRSGVRRRRSSQYAAVGGGPHLRELRGDAPGGRAAAAGHARARQARQRAGAREPDPPGLRGQTTSATTTTASARRCPVPADLRDAARGLRGRR